MQNLRLLIIAVIVLALTACAPESTEPEASSVAETEEILTLENDKAAIDKASEQLDETGFMAHVNELASDAYAGRAPSTPGGRKTVAYLEGEFEKLGLEPAFGEGEGKTYRQAVALIEQTVTNDPAVSFQFADQSTQTLPYKAGSMVWSTRVTQAAALKNSDLVFVGYGVVAPEFGWNDYAGVDMTGKTAVILVNDPGFRAPDGDLFKGNTMTYYGRWTYKYEEAARQGAAGAIIVHEAKAAGYGWEVVSGSWSGAQYMLFTEDGNKGNVAVEGWISQPAAKALFEKSGLNYQKMVAQAGELGFAPVAMPAVISTSLEITSKRSTSYNVGGVLPGRARPDELFLYTGHWDHLGIKPVDGEQDVIFNGAQDNATGTAALLEMAQAFNALPQPPERSVLFLVVTAEESGLLGSQQYAVEPAFPMAKTVAGINIDAMSTYGATDDIVVVGYGNSEMDSYLKMVSDTQGRVLVQEPTPEKGFFYRSDHFNMAKKGVPMLYAEAGEQVRGKPEGYGKAESERYGAERYHKPADEVHAEWDNGGIMQDLNAHFRIGVAISDSNDWPKWADGNEFKAIREASQK